MTQGSVLVPLQLGRAEQEAALLDYSLAITHSAVYLHCSGPAAEEPPTLATLDYVTHCLEPAAHGKPRANVYPLLPFLGWAVERIATQLRDVTEVVAAAEHADECHALIDRLNAVRPTVGLPSIKLTLTAGHVAANDAAAPAQQGPEGGAASGASSGPEPQSQQGGESVQAPRPQSRVIGEWPSAPALQFKKVAVGGTFDRLHAGHRLLLAATAVVATEQIFVGITADKLLASKKNRELLESYEERQAAAVAYMELVNPRASVMAGPLTDPSEPPLCAFDPEFDAIVVSEETVPGAHTINQVREKQGFPPLTIVVVGLIYSRHSQAKLSSTDLREADAAGTYHTT
ncbi:hypothetical protein D9Q98_000368 [Chlorella vulgaris]|uniref:Cytidyltransferase-like domain-containing protein n=1 Tax=Chlorella vulgaris TaxID=3077 RepID=A0A9D4TY25_CHLVU|nr:hypothetical protein D9Q98_000368 [Chlorella vulgaris]